MSVNVGEDVELGFRNFCVVFYIDSVEGFIDFEVIFRFEFFSGKIVGSFDGFFDDIFIFIISRNFVNNDIVESFGKFGKFGICFVCGFFEVGNFIGNCFSMG